MEWEEEGRVLSLVFSFRRKPRSKKGGVHVRLYAIHLCPEESSHATFRYRLLTILFAVVALPDDSLVVCSSSSLALSSYRPVPSSSSSAVSRRARHLRCAYKGLRSRNTDDGVPPCTATAAAGFLEVPIDTRALPARCAKPASIHYTRR